MATTTLFPIHAGKGRTIADVLGYCVDYVENGEKTDGGEWVTSYECDPLSAAQEFLFSKREYLALTGRDQGKNDVIAYHLRISFKPGETDPETANRIGYDLAMKLTKGHHAFVCCTHTDKAHMHSHIIINSVSIDYTKKFRNFKGSTFAIRRIADQLCLKNGLSVIENPKPSKGKGYRFSEPPKPHIPAPIISDNKPNLLIDIQAKIAEGKGPAYEQWAQIFNLKQAAKTLLFLKEMRIDSYEELVERASTITGEFHAIMDKIKAAEKRMAEISELQKSIGTYGKTLETFRAYKRSGWSNKFFEANRADITLHRAAKKHFKELGLEKLPPMAALKQEWAKLSAEKKKLYAGYKITKENMVDLLRARDNATRMLGLDKNAPGRTQKRSHSLER